MFFEVYYPTHKQSYVSRGSLPYPRNMRMLCLWRTKLERNGKSALNSSSSSSARYHDSIGLYAAAMTAQPSFLFVNNKTFLYAAYRPGFGRSSLVPKTFSLCYVVRRNRVSGVSEMGF